MTSATGAEQTVDASGVGARLWAAARRTLTSMVMLAAFLAVLLAVAWSRTRANLRAQLGLLGRDMLVQQMLEQQKEDGALDDDDRVLVLNGQPLQIGVGVEDRSLDAIQAEHPGDCLPGGDGSVACLSDVGAGGFAAMLRGDFSGLEHLEYRLYEAKEDGRSFFFRLKPAEGFDPRAMLPSRDHDVPGPEHADVPRPPDSVRVLSAYERGRPYLMSMFLDRVGRSRESLTQWYRDRMSREQWTELPLEQVARERDLHPSTPAPLWFHRRGRTDQFVVLTFKEAEEGERPGTITTILEAQ